MAYVGDLTVEFRICGKTSDVVLSRQQAYELMRQLQKVFKEIDPPSRTADNSQPRVK